MSLRPTQHLIRDLIIVIFSIVVALNLYRSGAINVFLEATEGLGVIRIFVAGLFFTSIFTTAFSLSMIFSLSATYDPWVIAVIGGFGALLGDYIIFKFFRSSVSDDVEFVLSHTRFKRVLKAMHMKSMRWFMSAIGAIIIASPFPDEIGLALMGLADVPNKYFIPVSYAMNMIGIFILANIGSLIA